MTDNNRTTAPQYCCHKPVQNLPHVSLFEPGILDCRLPWCCPNISSSYVKINVKDDSSDRIMWAFPVVWCPGFMVVTPSFRHLSTTFSNLRFSNCSPSMDARFVKLTSDSFCGNRVFKMNIQFFCPDTCAANCDFLKQSFSMCDDLFLTMLIFTHCSSLLMLSSHDSCILTKP
jgi:hypothetical protein